MKSRNRERRERERERENERGAIKGSMIEIHVRYDSKKYPIGFNTKRRF